MSKYVIKVTRILPESWKSGGGKEEHYFQKMITAKKKEGLGQRSSYDTTSGLDYANRFTEQQFKEFVEKIKIIYERDSDIGTLLSIEVLDTKPSYPIVMTYPVTEPEPEIITSRFELMEL